MARVNEAALRGAVDGLRTAIGQLERVATADDSLEEPPGSGAVEAAVNEYIRVTDAEFATILASDDDEAGSQAAAQIGLDLRMAQELLSFEAGPSALASDDESSLLEADVDLALDALLNGAPRPAALGDDQKTVDDVVTAIDTIITNGTASLAKVGSAAFIPSPAQLGEAAGAVFGAAVGELVQNAIASVSSWWKKVAKAAAELLGKVLERIASIFGKEAGEKAKAWFEDLIAGEALLGRLLATDALKDQAKRVLPSHLDRCALAAAVPDRHAHDIRWINWGATALTLAKKTSLASGPAGPMLLAAVSVALVAGSVWLTQDHLDSANLGFFPDRVRGVGDAIGS